MRIKEGIFHGHVTFWVALWTLCATDSVKDLLLADNIYTLMFNACAIIVFVLVGVRDSLYHDTEEWRTLDREMLKFWVFAAILLVIDIWNNGFWT